MNFEVNEKSKRVYTVDNAIENAHFFTYNNELYFILDETMLFDCSQDCSQVLCLQKDNFHFKTLTNNTIIDDMFLLNKLNVDITSNCANLIDASDLNEPYITVNLLTNAGEYWGFSCRHNNENYFVCLDGEIVLFSECFNHYDALTLNNYKDYTIILDKIE